MKRFIIINVLVFCIATLFSQVDKKEYAVGLSHRIDAAVFQQYHRMESYFKEAYSLYPTVPRGLLEAVSFTYTRFTHLVPSEDEMSDGHVPCTYGLMGLTLDGRGFFRDNLRLVSELSGFPVESIASSPHASVVAYAAAYASLQQKWGVHADSFEEHIPILKALSELPLSEDSVLNFALNSNLYAIAKFIDDDLYRSAMGITMERPDYLRCFGDQLPLLQSAVVQLPDTKARGEKNGTTDYEGAIWTPAGSCNYTVGRGGHAISSVAIHYTQGTYASSIAWFQNCTYNGVGARASAHYVIRSIDGQVTQMVREADKAWHVGNCNPYTIGIEHEAYGDIASYFTPEMYQSSANLVRDICDRNNISPHRMFYRDTLDDGTILNSGLHSLGGESACVKIRGHQHFPNQTHTDPGPYWDWNYYYKLVNDDTPIALYNAPSGILTDSGGPDEDYGNDERCLWLIQVEGADNITLSFNEFDLEDNYDFLWIYDGNSVYAPLLGRWNTSSPGTVTSSGNALLVEFRSDCETTAAGWNAGWQATTTAENQPPVTTVLWNEDQWITENFTLSFNDTDDNAVTHRFYQTTGNNGREWTANPACGFVYDDFEYLNSRLWSVVQGNWSCQNDQLRQTSTETSEMTIPLRTNLSKAFLYEFDMALSIGSGTGQTAGIRFGCTGSSSCPNAYEMTVAPIEHTIRISRLNQGTRSTLCIFEGVITCPDSLYHYQVVHDEPAHTIFVFRNGQLFGECQIPPAASSPSNGTRMSFVTQETSATFDNLRVYQSRNQTVDITIGYESNCHIAWQASNGSPMAKIRSVIMDDELAFSEVAESFFRVDFSRPSLRGSVSFGLNESAEYSPTNMSSFHWPNSSDPHSEIAYYEYGICSESCVSPAAITWIGTTEDNHIRFHPNIRITEPCFFAVRAVNGAELRSDPIFSEVCIQPSRTSVVERYDIPEKTLSHTMEGSEQLRLWPNPVSGKLHVELPVPSVSLSVFDVCGREIFKTESTDTGTVGKETLELDVAALKKGIYFVRSIGQTGKTYYGTFLKQ